MKHSRATGWELRDVPVVAEFAGARVMWPGVSLPRPRRLWVRFLTLGVHAQRGLLYIVALRSVVRIGYDLRPT